MDIIGALVDKEKTVTTTLKESAKIFAEEIGCPVEEVRVLIAYTKDGEPYYLLFHRNQKIREVSLDEIL